MPAVQRRWVAVALAVLALQFSVLAGIEAWRDAPTVDETVHLASGVTALTRRDARINYEHPPLGKVLAALPVLLAGPAIPSGASWERGAQFEFIQEFVRAQRGRLQLIVFLGRLVPIAEAVAVGALLYLLGAALFARLAGLLAAALWFTSPWVVGLGHINGVDLPFTTALLVCTWVLQRHAREPSWRRAAVVGVCAGAVLLTHFKGLIVAPVVAWAASVPVRGGRRRLAVVALVGALAWTCVWVGMRALDPSGPSGEVANAMADTAAAGERATALARAALLVPWPAEYEAGIGYQALIRGPGPVFLMGRSWTGWRWWFWPGSILVKFPLPALAFVAGGLVAGRRAWRRDAALAVWPVGGALGLFTVVEPTQLGLRYLMPVLALGLVAASPAARLARSRLGRLVLAGVGVSQLVSLWTASPHSLAWTAPPFRPGYRFAADSNLDWGQDIGRFERWARGREVRAWLFRPLGTDTLADLEGVRPLKGVPPAEVHGWVAASASALTTYGRKELAWLRKYCPVADIGGTILLFRFERPPSPEPGRDAPPPPCRNSPVSLRR